MGRVHLCSSGAGPWPVLINHLPNVDVTLTDLHPNVDAFRRAAANSSAIRLREESLDALDVPPDVVGCRTIINGLHHFEPEQAIRILEAVVAAREPIVVLEMLSRSVAHVVASPLIVVFLGFESIPRMSCANWSRTSRTVIVSNGRFRR